MIKSKFLLFLLLFCSPVAMAQEQDKLLQLLKSELTYGMNELKKQAQAPYYMNLRAMDDYTVNVTSSFGAIASSRETRMRTLVPQVRLGSLELDNFKYNSQGAAQDPRRGNVSGVFLPLDDETTEGIREAIWRETLKRYKFAQQQLEVSKTKATVSVEDEDKAPCFSGVTAEKYYEAPLDGIDKIVDVAVWEKRLNEVSAVFKACPELQQGMANLTFQVYRTYLVSSEGAEVAQNRVSARVMLSASIKAADGMVLPLNMDYFAYNPDELPGIDRMVADAKEMTRGRPVYGSGDPFGSGKRGVLPRDFRPPAGRSSFENGRPDVQENGGRASVAGGFPSILRSHVDSLCRDGPERSLPLR